jgi:hypothetical protein
VVRDSGSVLIKNLPGGSAVFVDGAQLLTSPAKLAVGSHDLLIRPPMGYESFESRIEIQKDQQLVVAPSISRVGAARAPAPVAASKGQCNSPTEPGYNADDLCWDTRARPVSSPEVPYANGGAAPTIIWVRVSADGSTLDVRPVRPSNDAGFEQAAYAYARQMKWNPATKGGTSVEGWTQQMLRPGSQ